MEYWSQRLHKPIEDIYSVDWPSLASAISSLPPAQQRRASKHASGHFGCGSKLLQWQHQDHDECPFCNQVENPHHVLTCPHPQPQQTWQTTIQKLQDKLTTMETDPALNTAIIQSLNNWNHHTAPPEHPPEHPVSQQTRIGWYPMIHGQISTAWQEAQATYFASISSKKSPKRWTIQLIKQLLNIAWDMWSHRNGFKHGPNGPDQQHLRKELQERIEYEYSIGQHNLLPHDRHWLQQPIAAILNYNTSTQQQWIQSVNNARERHHAQPTEDPSLNQQRELLRNWLQQPHQT